MTNSIFFFFSSRRRHTRCSRDWSSDVCSSDLNVRVDWHPAPNGVPTFQWRSVGHSHTAFVVETLIDEVAHAAGKDPFEFRRGLLDKHPRAKRVLEFVADKAGWGKPPP